ncbi:MAG TPA: response regulator [Terriglobales bacterium]|jgi:FixJ family two-component response regulator|nr:response regulator [Terriglobales bacterium]
MANLTPVIYVVDDDVSVRDAVSNLLASAGHRAEAFSSTEEFLDAMRPEATSCLVLDIKLPGVSGLDFQEQLEKAGIPIPIIIITAHGDIPMTRRAMKAGAIEFLTKPFQKEELLAAIHQALDRDRVRRDLQAADFELRSKFEKLTPREREIMDLVVAGLLNKQIADKLDLSEVTVKFHRRHVMDKMQAASLADLVRMSEKLNAGARRR